MATLQELIGAYSDAEMVNLTKAAVVVKAAAILQEATPSEARLAWAQSALASPQSDAPTLWKYVVGANSGASLDAILRSVGDVATPTDATVQTAVDTAIDKFWP